MKTAKEHLTDVVTKFINDGGSCLIKHSVKDLVGYMPHNAKLMLQDGLAVDINTIKL